MAYKVVIDAGHGGADPGAVYEGRQEKDDVLALALAVGELLEQNGIDVVYTRTEDVYDTPFEKAMIANNSGADYFVSLHRNAVPTANTATGIETLVFRDGGVAGDIARSINSELENLGFNNRGVIERPNLVVLKRTRMPAVLVEAGFINNEADNAKFDEEFDGIAAAIANGILDALDVDFNENAGSNNSSSMSSSEAVDDTMVYSDEAVNVVTDNVSDYYESDDINYYDDVMWPDYRMNEGRGNSDSNRANLNNNSQNNNINRNIWGVLFPENSNIQGGIISNIPLPGNRPNNRPDNRPGNRPGDGRPGNRPDGGRPPEGRLYRVQTGAFRVKRYADDLVERLRRDGFAPFVVYNDGLYRVQIGAFRQLDNAVKMEQRLRNLGYNTFISS